MTEVNIKRVNKILVQIAENQDQLERLNELDNKVAATRQELDSSYIKIPFTERWLFDDLGIIKHNVPTLLERDRQLVDSYNKLLQQFKDLAAFIGEEIDQLAADNGIAVTGNCFDKLSQIIKALDIGERPYIPD
jgi:vacuolar-type H+-ATPase subunit I/STV1